MISRVIICKRRVGFNLILDQNAGWLDGWSEYPKLKKEKCVCLFYLTCKFFLDDLRVLLFGSECKLLVDVCKLPFTYLVKASSEKVVCCGRKIKEKIEGMVIGL